MKPRKKVCTHCKRKLWLRDFYPLKTGGHSSWCRECQRENKRRWYEENRKVPDGIRYDARTGRKTEHNGLSTHILWTPQMLSDLQRFYPTTTNEELAGIFGVSQRTITRKARELGLEKDQTWLHALWDRNRCLANVVARRLGHPGHFQKGTQAGAGHRFQKGHQLTAEEKEKQRKSLRRYYTLNPGASKLRTRKLMKAVVCSDSGEQWPSLAEASKAIGVCCECLSTNIKAGRPVKGRRYEFLNQINVESSISL